MHWSMLGWSHHHTPIELRERLAFSPEQVQQFLGLFQQKYDDIEVAMLSTCNRVELYCATESQQLPTMEQLGLEISAFHGLSFSEIKQQSSYLIDEPVIKHLFLVAASLDSMILGEAQILSQVRQAYDLACQCNTASTLMHRAFQRATAVARRVANETTIHRRRISVPSVAVSEIATEFFERFDDKKILLIGAGEMGVETLRYLLDAGAKKIRIINRSFERAQEVAREFSISADPWEMLHSHIASAELVVSTTSSPETIISASTFRQIRSSRKHAVLILDLAVPRDFEPSIAEFPDTYLYSVDDLQQVCDRNLEARKAEWPRAMQIVEQETKKFDSESRHAGSGSTIKKLREQAEQIKQDELKRLLDKLQSHGLDPQVEKELSYAFDRLVNKILHPPLQSLRDNADSSHHASLLDALKRLFQISD
jgi:glutamyl-tRNA reductase